jgi:hypothetical protein
MKKTQTIGCSVEPDLADQVRAAAKSCSLTVSEFIRGVLEEAIQRGVQVRRRTTYEIIEPPKNVLKVAKRGKRYR